MQISTIIKKIKINGVFLGAPILSSLLLVLAFPRFDQGYLAWIGAIPLLWFCLRATGKQAFWGGFSFGFLFHFYINFYLAVLFWDYLSVPLALLTFLLMLLILSFFYAIFSFLVNYISRFVPTISLALLIPTLWIIMEYTRSLGMLGYTAGYLGYSQWAYPFILNTTAVYGYWGMAFLMILVQTIPVLKWEKLLPIASLHKISVAAVLLLFIGLLLPLSFNEKKEDSTYHLALVQPNNPQEAILSSPAPTRLLERYLELTRNTLEENPELDLIVWPETAVSYHIGKGDPLLEEIKDMAEIYQVSFLYGAVYTDGEDRYNSIILWDYEREKAQMYFKNRLVPVVEYFPFPDLLNRMVDIDYHMGAYTPGEKANTLKWKEISLGGVVCFESYFGDYTRKLAYQEIDHLFILTNDGWFDGTIGKEQHAYVAAIRAAEMGIGVTQVANTGITLSFDQQGNKVMEAPSMERDVFYLETDFPTRNTVYRYAGEYFLYTTALIGLSLILIYRFLKTGKGGNQ